jgi:hypothetical protein
MATGRAAADVPEGLTQADRRRRLALAERRRRDRRDDDISGLRDVGQLVERGQLDLGDVRAVGLQQVLADPHLGGHVGERLERRCVGNGEVGQRRHGDPSRSRPERTARPGLDSAGRRS